MGTDNDRIELCDLSFPDSYFEDEVREGFYVPSMMKRYWAGQLKVLSEIDKVCRKHSIHWFATYGTLIGAVRHGGYIPWDDDLDICMLRSDYEKFFEVARKELPEKYSVLNIRLEPEYENMIGRIVNNRNVIDYSEEHMRDFFGCPYTIGVDIFPLDNVYDDEDREEERVRRLKDISDLSGMVTDSGNIISDKAKKLKRSIEKDNNIRLDTSKGLKRELRLLSERIYSECKCDDTGHVALMPIWVEYHANKFPRDIFENEVMTSFENMEIPIPGLYNEFLTIAYADYMKTDKSSGLHIYPVYSEQEQMLADKIGHNPFRYTYSEEDLRNIKDKRKDHKTTDVLCNEMAELLCDAARHILSFVKSGDCNGALQFLEGSQSVAISLGTMLEERVEGSVKVVRLLEEYCESLYECHEDRAFSGYEGLEASAGRIKKELVRCLSVRRKRVIFLPCTAKWWYTMFPYYTKLKETGSYELTILSLPYYELSYDGTAELIEESGVFGRDISVGQVTAYDFEHGYADEIVIQIPYDGTNTSIRVPSFFYSSNLIKYTDKLTYLPYLTPECPENKNFRIEKSLALLVEQPAVVYADRIVLESEGMKQVYVDRMCELAGEDSRDYWENKMVVATTPDSLVDPVAYNKRRSRYRKLMPESIKEIAAGRKILIYYVDVSYLLQYGIDAIGKMRRNIACFDDARDDICCMLVREDRLDQFDEADDELNELKQGYDELTMEIDGKPDYVTVPYEEAERYIIDAAAFYGTAGELAHKCRLSGKPVMIMGDVTI